LLSGRLTTATDFVLFGGKTVLMNFKDNSLLIGRLIKPHSTRGSLILGLIAITAVNIKEGDPVFIDIEGLLVPFFIEELQERTGNSVIIKFEGISSESKAKELAGRDVYLSMNKIRQEKKLKVKMSGIEGYKVIDKNYGFVGNAGNIEDISNNPLLKVHYNGKEFLIPVHEDIFLEVNTKKKEIIINAPEGLFEI
jgi:16S rRNA processing protein RimM